jgi:formylglycine-generating enzyme required for sulfatase activity
MKILFLFSFTLLAAAAATAQNRPGSDFVLINGGTFTMGSPAGEPERGMDEEYKEATK